ncbi:TraB/GumN family protein [Enterococcus sp. BWT-B8]|uniref:TraB/GumN family protein n=1 Tax=unclassified Enterococcus TaxID=2608891 RepID=UPI001E3A2DEB|nr:MULTISPECIES: TraB/GumN family protein [unclassified Enterococcus]MCB5952014.1 TraB/GumN family protein [Enterococcus sp. BWT-B8]MCB5954576.1 TraB/GumN family protein [Enterococcus sp. CWB-B31]
MSLDEAQKRNEDVIDNYIDGNIENNFSDLLVNASEEYNYLLITKRNIAWLDTLEKELNETAPIFIAVGAGDLYGENGLISLLEQTGYLLDKVV